MRWLPPGTRVIWDGEQGTTVLLGTVKLYTDTDPEGCPYARSAVPVCWDNGVWQMVGEGDVRRVTAAEETEIRNRAQG